MRHTLRNGFLPPLALLSVIVVVSSHLTHISRSSKEASDSPHIVLTSSSPFSSMAAPGDDANGVTARRAGDDMQ